MHALLVTHNYIYSTYIPTYLPTYLSYIKVSCETKIACNLLVESTAPCLRENVDVDIDINTTA